MCITLSCSSRYVFVCACVNWWINFKLFIRHTYDACKSDREANKEKKEKEIKLRGSNKEEERHTTPKKDNVSGVVNETTKFFYKSLLSGKVCRQIDENIKRKTSEIFVWRKS